MTAPTQERHTPFHCGTQRFDWKCYNCDECSKGYDDKTRTWPCDLEKKIDEAYMDDGTIDAETARRMGEDFREYNWRCPEFEQATPRPPEPTLSADNKPADWIADWAAKRGISLTP